MTNHDQIDVQNESFLSRLAQEVRAAQSRHSLETVSRTPHPAADVLYDYVAGWLDERDAHAVRAHLAHCTGCGAEALGLMKLEDELERESLDWADNPDSALLPVAPPAFAETTAPALHAFKHHAIQWISDLGEPQWAGQLLTAADVPEQTHTFTSEHGDIRVTCHWHDDLPDEPAMIHVRWHADLVQDECVWVRFLNPANQSLRQEIFLGTRAVGEESFTIQDLAFDFLREAWGISLALL